MKTFYHQSCVWANRTPADLLPKANAMRQSIFRTHVRPSDPRTVRLLSVLPPHTRLSAVRRLFTHVCPTNRPPVRPPSRHARPSVRLLSVLLIVSQSRPPARPSEHPPVCRSLPARPSDQPTVRTSARPSVRHARRTASPSSDHLRSILPTVRRSIRPFLYLSNRPTVCSPTAPAPPSLTSLRPTHRPPVVRPSGSQSVTHARPPG